MLSISAANSSIKLDTKDYEDENNLIDKSNEKISNVFSALGFETAEFMYIKELKEINIKIFVDDKIHLEFSEEIQVDKEFTKKVVLILADKKGVKYKIVENKVQITVEK